MKKTVKKKNRTDINGNLIVKGQPYGISFDSDVTVCLFEIDEEVIHI